MKLSRIKLKDYYQFKNLEIDLTYPRGHKKEWRPLDKVCFLGQSGTGKTTLLRLIKWFISQKRDIGENIELPVPPVPGAIQMDFRLFDPDLEYRISNRTINEKLGLFLHYDWPEKMEQGAFFELLKQYIRNNSPVLINFPTELLWRKNRPHPVSMDPIDELDVPYEFWSTGTRQLIQTVLPLFQLKPKNAVILVDEPERSLYPDIQRHIVESYVKRAPGSQFFFATHSPIITSAFEPWEIVELKFDRERSQVYRESYYDGDNHVDNYKYYPEYMRWDSILQRIFDLDEEGSKKRTKGLKRLIELEVRIDQFKNKNKLDSTEGRKLVEEYLLLNRKLGWRPGKRNS